MLKRPQQPDGQEQQQTKAENTDDTQLHQPHKSHSRHSKNNFSHPHNHTARHHRKHDKINLGEPSITGPDGTFPSENTSTTRKNRAEERTTEADPAIPPTEIEESAHVVTSRPKKNGRRQRPREGFDANPVLEVEDVRNQQRRKKHHRRKNSTLLTNSVHDEVSPDVLVIPESELSFGIDQNHKTQVILIFLSRTIY